MISDFSKRGSMSATPSIATAPSVNYNDKVVRQFAVMAVVWGVAVSYTHLRAHET